MIDVESTLRDALDHHRAGRPVDAHRLYKRVLADRPDEPDALHLLGLLTADNGNPAAAADLIRRAIAARPNVVDYHLSLARVLRAGGKPADAAAVLQSTVDMNPLTDAATYRDLAEVLVQTGRHAEAAGPMQRAVELEPTAESLALLGELLVAANRVPEAYRALIRAVQLRPDWAAAHGVLGSVQDRQGDLPAAEASYRRAIDVDADLPEARNNLGSVLLRQNRAGEAAEHLRRAVALRPVFPQAHNNLGRALAVLDRPAEAMAAFRAAVAQAPQFPEAWDGLGRLLLADHQWGEASDALRRATQQQPTVAGLLDLALACGAVEDMDGALDALRRAVELDPTSAEAFHQLGVSLRWSGQLAAAIAAGRRAVELDPGHAAAHGALCYALLTDDQTPVEIAFAEHVEWGRRHADPVERLPSLSNDGGLVDALVGGPRKLRIGYVSNSFRQSAIMSFIAPVLAHHDADAVEVICYSDTQNPDAVTTAARQHVKLWRRTATLSDEQLAKQVRDDRIDVLVELTGHLGGGRLGTLARRPAPVQISYLGYQGTTGVAAVDHVITDDWTDPPGRAELLYVEQPWRLPRPFFCWAPPADAPPVGPPAVGAAGHVTFGCLNAVAKATPAAVALWARVLSAVPDSHLVLLTTRCLATDERLRAGLLAGGVSPRRLRFVNRSSPAEYLARYHGIDVALDPVPFVGHTTTLDAAWMGVPTVTRAGDCYAHRYGSSALRAIGLGDLVAESDDAYVRTAVTLATDAERLGHLRATLRSTVAASAVCDAAGFTRDLEAAYRAMWDAR